MLYKISIKTKEEIEKMREVCKVTAKILDDIHDIVAPGISTEDINTFVHDLTLKLGATPAPLNYQGFPKSVCTSVNEVVCHGIPNEKEILKEGDILNIDVTSILDGYYGDASRMYFVGGKKACSSKAIHLVETAKQAMNIGIQMVKPGNRIGDIGYAISRYVNSLGKNYGIVRDYTGHGIGKVFHELPQVVHIATKGSGEEMRPGMTFTIEPMINEGTFKTECSTADGWTVWTRDRKLSAQWEETVLVTETGVEILTKSKIY
ncbi:MAG: type I methionyl aminopeptidase [Bdellovibrionota bacterium]